MHAYAVRRASLLAATVMGLGSCAAGGSALRSGSSAGDAALPFAAVQGSVLGSDDFAGTALGEQWKWNRRPGGNAWSLRERPGFLRLHAFPAANLFASSTVLTEPMQAGSQVVTVRLELKDLIPGDRTGLTMLGQVASGVELVPGSDSSYRLSYFYVARANDGAVHDVAKTKAEEDLDDDATTVLLRARVHGGSVRYSFSDDEGKSFRNLGPETAMDRSQEKGARPGLFLYGDGGFVDVDFVRVEPLP